MKLKERLTYGTLLFDGGIGTYFGAKYPSVGYACEYANRKEADKILALHKDYLEAGSEAITTNTFAVNRVNFQGDEDTAAELISQGFAIASEAARDYNAFVFADVGPVSRVNEEIDPATEYIWVAEQFLKAGAENFVFETNANTDGLKEVAAYIKEKNPESFILTSFAVSADGFSRDGIFAQELVDAMRDSAVDAIGFNCVCSARHMLELVKDLNHEGILLSLQPNAGYPIVVQNRTIYEGDPLYFADQVAALVKEGAAIVGGCCGTTPVHIEKIKSVLDKMNSGSDEDISAGVKDTASAKHLLQPTEELAASLFWDKLLRKEKVIAVELDPPSDVTLTKFMSGAWQLKGAGADVITIADCPIGRARMDSSLLACKVRRELGMDALPHMTCRDRNLNATKALLLGLYAEGVRNVLLVTGDPIPTAERDEVKSVFQFNSRKLAAFVKSLGEKQLPGELHMFGALDVNARNFDVQLRIAKEKMENGMVGFLTQPVLTENAFANLKRAREELNHAYILGGIIPVVSAKNARFMENEVNGISVDPKITEKYEGKTREEAEKLGIDISVEIAKQIAPYVDGFYLMTPFGRTGMMAKIIEGIQEI